MKLKTLPFIISRTPAFSLTSNLSEVWDDLKEKIRESSPTFYELIKNEKVQNLDALPEKTHFTIWKYFNRAKYRATPFGSFAAISIFPLGNELTPAILAQHIVKHHFIDWGEKEKHVPHKVTHKTSILTNSSIYKLGNELRYLMFSDQHFELASVTLFPELEFMLRQCQYKTTLAALCLAMKDEFGFSAKNTKDLIKQLISLQLVITDNAPNITGTDYFKRLNIQMPKVPEDYIIAERKVKSGGLNEEKLKLIPTLISFLHKNLTVSENRDLTRFKAAFIKKFETRAVSLAIAMDPEAGIGYGNLEQAKEENELIAALKSDPKKYSAPIDFKYTKFHSFLLNKIATKTTIQLEEFSSPTENPVQKLPNTFSLMFHFFDGNPVIGSIGGATGNALLGRFTLANEEFTAFAHQMSEIEANANPEIRFFDIAYQVENHIDNVNRRSRLYAHELPVLTYHEGDSPLNFDDILIAIHRNEIVLTSKKLGQRIVPRIPSAYNYTRSDLAAYRFLCDIQNQGLAINLNFTLKDFFGGLSYYPRVCYHHIIVSPAMWLLPKHFYRKTNITVEDQLIALREWLNMRKINFLFKIGVADHTLCIDPSLDVDLRSFLFYCNQFTDGDLYITEALIKKEDGIADENNQIYAPQYIANYYHDEQIYAPTVAQTKSSKLPTKTDIKLPGEDWLYFDIYTHPSRSNAILLNEIKQYIRENEKSIVKWFFIRYTDPSPHLRLRLQLTEDAPGFAVIHSLMNLIKPLLLSGLVTDFGIKTYYRETQRYGVDKMDLVEYFFFQDSRYILRVLAKGKENEQLYAQTITLFANYISASIPDIDHQLAFTKQIATSFSEEMQISAEHFKKINASYNLLKKNMNTLVIPIPNRVLKIHERAFMEVIDNCTSTREKEKMLADLIHMHINRLFKIDQRMHETIIYQYLLQLLRTKKARLCQ